MLSKLLITAEQYKLFAGVKISRLAPPLSHLMFVDDLSKAGVEDAEVIKFCLNTYSSWSGQLISSSKSGFFISNNTAPTLVPAICHELGMKKADLEGKYLGLPLNIPRSRKASFKDIQERVFFKLEGCKPSVYLKREGSHLSSQ